MTKIRKMRQVFEKFGGKMIMIVLNGGGVFKNTSTLYTLPGGVYSHNFAQLKAQPREIRGAFFIGCERL